MKILAEIPAKYTLFPGDVIEVEEGDLGLELGIGGVFGKKKVDNA